MVPGAEAPLSWVPSRGASLADDALADNCINDEFNQAGDGDAARDEAE